MQIVNSKNAHFLKTNSLPHWAPTGNLRQMGSRTSGRNLPTGNLRQMGSRPSGEPFVGISDPGQARTCGRRPARFPDRDLCISYRRVHWDELGRSSRTFHKSNRRTSPASFLKYVAANRQLTFLKTNGFGEHKNTRTQNFAGRLLEPRGTVRRHPRF